jgi:hypothetical protein
MDSVSTIKIHEEEERMRAPKMPGPSAEERAMTRRQREALDQEIAENEARLKRIASGRLGKQSLLATGSLTKAPKKSGINITPGFKREGGKTVAIPRGRGRRTRTGR